MDAVTYPHETVVAEIGEHFAPFRINMMERHPDFREACAGGRVLWGPTFVIADSRGSEVRRWVGWLPPRSFVAELSFCRALAADKDIAFFSERVDVRADALTAGRGLEEQGRLARMDFLRRVSSHQRFDRIALGHHQDDQAETFLLRLLLWRARNSLVRERRVARPFRVDAGRPRWMPRSTARTRLQSDDC